ncbi:MAG: M3 family metallopeptidase [Candidatus Absconditabacteria bacterium]
MKKTLLAILGVILVTSQASGYELNHIDALFAVNATNKIHDIISKRGVETIPSILKQIDEFKQENKENQRVQTLLDIIISNINNKDSIAIQEKILQELNKIDLPNLEFLYDENTIEHIPFVLDRLIEQKQVEFYKLLETPLDKVDWNLIKKFSQDDKLNYLYSLVINLNNVKGTDQVRFIIQMFQDKLVNLQNEMTYSKPYYQIYKTIQKDTTLNAEEKRIVDKAVKMFELSGIGLDDEKIATLKTINQKLTKLSYDFGENLLNEQKNYSYYIDSIKTIEDIPEDILSIAKEAAKKEGKEGYLFHVNIADYLITYCTDTNVRKEVRNSYKSFASTGKYDNSDYVVQMLKLRQQMAELLGYNNYGEYSLSDKMAPNPEYVMEQEDKIRDKAVIKADKEIQEIKDFFNIDTVDVWDHGYYTRLLKKDKYDFDSSVLREYFEYNKVIEGLFNTANKLYGLEFVLTDAKMYDKSISVYKVIKDGDIKGYYILDPFYNPDKSSGAWADIVRSRQLVSGKSRLPIVMNVMNISAGEDKTLLDHYEVATIFHEFGHALHALLSVSNYSDLNGFSVEWDFVELPSQLMENWAYGEGLKSFSFHHETGEPISDDLISKIQNLKTFSTGVMTITQIIYSRLDMGLHTNKINSKQDLEKVVDGIFDNIAYFKTDKSRSLYNSFSHIFNGGYSAGYYSYLWAEIIEADVYAQFAKNGLFDKDTAQRFYDTILSQGSIKPAIELFKDFMGRDISLEGFYVKKGY